jgi:flavin reductase (DIM6/NTAB) family NADH-FMN oxidoreductase RutF
MEFQSINILRKEGTVMRKNFGAKPYTYPQPVFILASYGEDGTPDAMNAAWGGISGGSEVTMCISARHKSTENILKKKAFTISMADAAHVKECDYVGLASANDTLDKLAKAGFTVSKAEFVDAPVINELAVCVECKLVSYDEKSGHMVGEIVNVSVDESALTPDGEVDVAKVEPISFDPFNNKYVKVTEIVGNAFADGKELM